LDSSKSKSADLGAQTDSMSGTGGTNSGATRQRTWKIGYDLLVSSSLLQGDSVNDIAKAISELERQRATIDRAIAALREVEGIAPAASTTPVRASRSGSKPVKRQMSAEGRRRISEAAKKRWAQKRAAEPLKAGKGSAAAKAPATKKGARPGRKRKAAPSALAA
jgi:hypothetical protein